MPSRKQSETEPRSTLLLQVNWFAFGEQIHVGRRRLGYSQQKLANSVGISRNYVSMIERGTADPGYTIVLSVCHVLNISPPKAFLPFTKRE